MGHLYRRRCGDAEGLDLIASFLECFPVIFQALAHRFDTLRLERPSWVEETCQSANLHLSPRWREISKRITAVAIAALSDSVFPLIGM